MGVTPFEESLAVLRIRDFRCFLGVRFFATLASQMQTLVVSWQVYQLTKDPLALGLIGLIEAVAFIGVSLWAGHFADRREKRSIILGTQLILLFCSGLLMMMAMQPRPSLIWIYGIIAVTGLARSFLWPASFAYSELTVPREIYSRAAALNSTGWEIGSILGPAIGGAIYAWKGPAAGYGAVVILAVLALGFALQLGQKPPQAGSPSEAEQTDLWSGIRFVFSKRIILAALTLDMFAVLFGGAYAVLPIFADYMKVGPVGLGWLRAAPSVGAILMAVYQSYRSPLQRVGQTLLLMVTCFGVSMIAFAFSKLFWLSWVLLAASGAFDNVSVVIRASILQAFTPNSMRGRVSSVNGIFIGSSNEIGAFESGLAARLMGLVPSVIFGGVMTLVTVAWVFWQFPDLRRLGAIHRPE